jgi:RNA polymerase sigma factor (sigma-70 family)
MTSTLGARTELGCDEAIEREYPSLLAFCRHLDWDHPEDLAQEATARTLQKLYAGEIHDLRAYLRTTARHVRADMVRAKYAHPVVLSDDLAAEAVEDPDVAQDLANREALLTALAQLSARELAVLRLADVDELSLDAIARRVGTSPSGVRSVLYRARHKARVEIERLKAKGMLAIAGPVSAVRTFLVDGGPNLAAGAATAIIAVAATLGALGHAQSTPSELALGPTVIAPPLAIDLVRPAPVAASPEPPPAAGVRNAGDARPGAPAAPRAVDRTIETDRPLLNPQAPDPWFVYDEQDRSTERAKPVYVAVPQKDVDCDGEDDVYFIVSDDPWAESGQTAFGGSAPPGLDGQLVHQDLAATETPSTC